MAVQYQLRKCCECGCLKKDNNSQIFKIYYCSVCDQNTFHKKIPHMNQKH